MSASHASLTDIPAADVAHTDAKWTPVRNHFGITAFGVNAYTARNTGDRLIGEHDHADPTDEQHQELYFVHAGHARFQVDGQDVDAPAGTFVSALDVKTILSAVALADNTVGARDRRRAWRSVRGHTCRACRVGCGRLAGDSGLRADERFSSTVV